MKTALAYPVFSISIVFISWIAGMMATALIRRTKYYDDRLSHINLIPNESFNDMIGVGVVKWITKNTFFRFFNQKLKINGRVSVADLSALRAEMTRSEIDHLFAFAFAAIYALVQVAHQRYALALTMLLVNSIMNLHPSLLQQQNKRRIDKMIRKLQNQDQARH